MSQITQIDLHFLKYAKQQGEKSSFSRKKKGAVIAKDNRIISTGVSAHLDSKLTEGNHPSATEERYVATVNAELVALGSAVQANVPLAGATLYVSDAPNWYSFKVLVTMGIKRMVFYGPNTNERMQHYAQELGIQLLSVG